MRSTRRTAIPIRTKADLHQHVELAIQVELATVPPYLFAMYSLRDRSSEAALLLRSIVVEEMLHAALVTNLLLAVGGKPDYLSTRYMTAFPTHLPHHKPPLPISLEPCSNDYLENVFMRIEQPETRSAPAQPDEFETLGQFYHGLELGIESLSQEFDLFTEPQRDAQLSDSRYYQPVEMDAEDSGGLVLIDDVSSAIEAIEIIVHQGEGLSDDRWADPSHQELTHFHKLLQIADGTSPLGEVIPLRVNPTTSEYPGSLRTVSDLFNAVYRGLYLVMDRIFSADSNQSQGVGVLYVLMADVLSQLATFLVHQELGNGEHAAPTFEIYEFATDQPLSEIISLAAESASQHPELSSVHDALRGLGFMI